MAELDLLDRRRRCLGPVGDRLEQDLEPARRVRMVPRRVQPNEIRVREDLDGYSARAASRSAIAFMPQSDRREDASAHRGD